MASVDLNHAQFHIHMDRGVPKSWMRLLRSMVTNAMPMLSKFFLSLEWELD